MLTFIGSEKHALPLQPLSEGNYSIASSATADTLDEIVRPVAFLFQIEYAPVAPPASCAHGRAGTFIH
jgi:hypothetical protein